MPPIDDPLARLRGRAVFEDVLRDFWLQQTPPVFLKWPKFDHHYLDSYFMYEVVQALGGLKIVMETRKFTVVKRLLHISEGYTAFSTAGRQHYERWISPCEEHLKRAVEAEYKRCNHWSPTYDWLNVSTEPPNEDTALKVFRRSGEANRAVVRARYAVHQLEDTEINGPMPPGLSSECPATVRLDLRNHIIRMWHRDVKSRLDIYSALRDIPAKYHGLSCAVYTQLVIAGAINIGAIPLCTPVATKFARDKTRRRRRVAVIGAGFAGLTVARQLRSFGISVTILEARDRIGGRVHSVPKEGFSCNVDLGAMLITGLIQNPLALLAEQTEAQLHVVDNECSLFDTDGNQVRKEIDTWAEREYNLTLDVTAVFRKTFRTHSRIRNASLGEVFYRALAIRENLRQASSIENISDTPEQPPEPERELSTVHVTSSTAVQGSSHVYHTPSPNSSIDSRSPSFQQHAESQTDVSHLDIRRTIDASEGSHSSSSDVESAAFRAAAFTGEPNLPAPGPEERELVKRLLRWHVANLEYGNAGPLDTVSLMHWDQDDPYGFIGEHALVKSGFKTLLDGLGSGLERNIKLNTEVVAVEYSDTYPGADSVHVTRRENGNIISESFDAAVVTVPLGVLKSNSISFSPSLPLYKRNAIKRLGCGGLMKVILEFQECFWSNKDLFGNLRENEETRGEFYIFYNMEPCYGKPILIGMVAEPAAKWLEQLRDQEIVNRAMNVLRRRYPQAPYPVATAVSRWGNDKHSQGVYTNITTESSGVDYDLLARPVANSLFFAGEHTCRKYPTTCASAVISGLREAHRLVEAFKLVDSISAVHARSLANALEQEVAQKRDDCETPWSGPPKRPRHD